MWDKIKKTVNKLQGKQKEVADSYDTTEQKTQGYSCTRKTRSY